MDFSHSDGGADGRGVASQSQVESWPGDRLEVDSGDPYDPERKKKGEKNRQRWFYRLLIKKSDMGCIWAKSKIQFGSHLPVV